jgi:hypothetical protein
VADTGGSGGLISELTGGRVGPRRGYIVLTVVGLMLTWTLDVFHIVAYASRAFALYYAVEAVVAALACQRRERTVAAVAYGALAVLGLAVTVFGIPVEG